MIYTDTFINYVHDKYMYTCIISVYFNVKFLSCSAGMIIFITFAVVVFLLIAIVTMSMVVRYRKHQRKLGLMTGMYLIMILKALLIYMYIDTCSNSCNGFFVNIFVRTYVRTYVCVYVWLYVSSGGVSSRLLKSWLPEIWLDHNWGRIFISNIWRNIFF